MDVSEYRRRVEAELGKAAREGGEEGPGDLDAAIGELRDPEVSPDRLSAALRTVGLAVDDRPELVDALLELVRDTARPVDRRLAILGALEEIAIRLVAFPEKRPLYLDALRALLDDPSAELRRQAVEILAREKDEYAQRRLLAGLEGRSRALVPPAKAIQLLGYDVHAEHLPVLKQLVGDPPNRAAKIEALRVLGGDPSSGELLVTILEDKGENTEVRRMAAVALESAAPDDARRHARRIVLDAGERDDQLRAQALTTLALFGDPESLGRDDELYRRVEGLQTRSRSRNLRRACTAYMSRVG